ncbi:RdlA protein [Streptomyces sp. CNQ-509]|uniref:rodlin n=1 Tax=unclassified Streptomyces TaxID=2593676 RepID=UPI00062DD0D9|nr:rodlin [Streptomyces sp. CNQ-509]AKH82433.1 RdlA protein [Streptomyces sp. CNQ-509]
MKKYLKTAAVAVTMLGASAMAAPQALAADDTGDGPYANGNGSTQAYGNTKTGGYMSPNMSLINGSFNEPCIALPQVAKNFAGTTAVSEILSQNQNQTCAKNSSADQGDAPLSHLLDDFPILSGNGAGNDAG